MNFWIENENLKALLSTDGAQMKRLVNKTTNKNILFTYNEEKQSVAPILFPTVGKSKNAAIMVSGQEYGMAQHGFARNYEFELVQQDISSACFCLRSDEKTLAVYPYEFELYVTYTLSGRHIRVDFEVENIGENNMYFQLGYHPAFRIDGDMADSFVEFEQVENAPRYVMKDYLSDEPEECLCDTKILKLNEELFSRDALVFKGLASEWVKLKNANDNREIKVSFKGFPVFMIWSNAPGFVCLEPCVGCADSESFAGEMKEKQFAQEVLPGECSEFSVRIRVE